MNLKFYFFITLVSGFLFGCSKENNEQNSNVSITIESPAENQNFNNGEIVNLKAVIISDISIHGYEIMLHDKSKGNSNSLANKHIHGDKVDVAHSWQVSDIEPKDMEVEIIVNIDHSGASQSKKMKISYNK